MELLTLAGLLCLPERMRGLHARTGELGRALMEERPGVVVADVDADVEGDKVDERAVVLLLVFRRMGEQTSLFGGDPARRIRIGDALA